MIKKVVGIAIAVVFLAALVPNLNAQTELLSEDFEHEVFPPSGWSTGYDSGQNQWYSNDWYNRSNYTPGGDGQCAANDDDHMGYQPVVTNNYLESSWFSAVGYGIVWLAFDVDWYCWGSNYEGRVEVFNDGWETVWTYTGGSNHRDSRDSLNISTQAGENPEVSVRFVYHEFGSSWSWWYQVDDINIWGSEGGGPGEDSLDLEMTQIVRPKDEEEGGVAFRPACKIYSNLDGVTARVTCKIKKKTGGGYIYEDALNSVPLDEGYTEVDAFNYFTPEGSTHYNVLFVVEHEDDIDDSNNDMDKDWWGILGAQVDATEIMAPEDIQYNAFVPQAKFAEMISSPVDEVVMRCEITDLAYHAVVYVDSSSVESFDADEEKIQSFREVATDEIPSGAYSIRFWATQGKEDTPVGEEKSKSFDYEGIAETPVLETYTLDVVGNTVNYNIGAATDVSLRIYDASGKMVAELASGHHSAGSYSVNWNSDAASGIYFVKMITPDFSASDKLLRLY